MPEDAVIEEIQESPVEEAPAEATEIPVEEPQELEEPTEEPSEDEPAEEDEEASQGDNQSGVTGRNLPDNVKKSLTQIAEKSPEAAKVLKSFVKDTFYPLQEYRQTFEKPADAVAAKTLIDEIGGQEGIQQIAAEREEWSTLDKQYADGSPDFIKSIAEANPDAFLKVAPQAVNEWAARAPEQYGYYANTVTLNTLNNSGVSTANLRAAYEQYADNPQAQAVIAQIHNALIPLEQKKLEFEQRKTDPREEQLKQRETQFEQKRRADFEGNVANQAESYLKDKMTPAIDRIIGARKVDPEARKEFDSLVQQRVMKMLGDTPGFVDRLEANYRTGDMQKSAAYITAQYDRILPIAAKVIEPFLRNIQPSAPARKPGVVAPRAAAPGEVTLREMPEWNQIDFTKCTTADVAAGRAVLKSGKRASGWV